MAPGAPDRVYRAAWILPITDPPVRDGWVAIAGGRVAALGSGPRPDAVDLGRVALLPALVNAHTHLELSYLHERVPPSARFSEWIAELMALRRQRPDPSDPAIVAAATTAIASARAAGTGLFGDVGNTLVTVALLRAAGVAARVFYELLGFNVSDAAARVAAAHDQARAMADGNVRISLAPHAPYSVAPPLFAAIRAALSSAPDSVTSVHLGESRDEVEFVRSGTGAIRTMLEALGVWTDEWRSVLPAGTSPVQYLARIGFLDRHMLAVHGVQFDRADLETLRAIGATVVSCPRSNGHVGVGAPPLELFYRMEVEVAFGTDSLASAPDLNMFAELAEARRIAPGVAARRLLEGATRIGARALGFGDELGTIEPGKRAALIIVRVPPAVGDVEEYLVSGIDPGAVSWVATGT